MIFILNRNSLWFISNQLVFCKIFNKWQNKSINRRKKKLKVFRQNKSVRVSTTMIFFYPGGGFFFSFLNFLFVECSQFPKNPNGKISLSEKMSWITGKDIFDILFAYFRKQVQQFQISIDVPRIVEDALKQLGRYSDDICFSDVVWSTRRVLTD